MKFEELLTRLTDPSEEVREDAAAQLVGTDDPRALVPLMKAAQDEHPGVKYFARKALKDLQAKIAATVGLDDEDDAPPPPPAPVPPADDDLGLDELFGDDVSTDSPAVSPAVPEDDPLALDEIFSGPAPTPPPVKPAAPAVEDKMDSGTRDRVKAIQEIAENGDRTKLPKIIEILEQEKDKFLLATLIKAVGRLGDKTHMTVIAGYLKDKDNRVVANTIEAMEMLGNPKCVEYLLKLIAHSDNRVRANAMKAVWTFARENPLAEKLVMDRLKEMIFSSKSQMRESAIFVLSEIGSENALDLVSLSVNDSDENVRQKAQDAVAAIEAKLKLSSPVFAMKSEISETRGAEDDAAAEKEEKPDRRSKTPPKKPAWRGAKAPTTTQSGDDEDTPPEQDADVVQADRSRKGNKAPVMVGITPGSTKNPMTLVIKISVGISVLIGLAVIGLWYHTSGDFTKIGIPLNLNPAAGIEAPEETEMKRADWEQRLNDAKSYLDEGFYDEAIKEFKMVLKEKSGNTEAKTGIARAHLKRGDEFVNLEIYDKALEEFEQVGKFASPGSEEETHADEQMRRIKKSR